MANDNAAKKAEAEKAKKDAEAEKAKKDAEAEAAKNAEKESEAKKKKVDPFEAFGIQLYGNVREDFAAFVKDNAKDAKVLGEEAVRAILAQQILNTMPALVKLPESASPEMRAELSQIHAVRSEIGAIVAKAEKEDAQRVARIRGNASSVAAKIAGSVLSIGATVLVKGLLGA